MALFTWGQTVRIRTGAPQHPDDIAEVVGINDIRTEERAHQLGAAVGSRVYLVEFGDGSSIELAEKWLAPF
ncbi:MAG: hypothetical protein JST54_05010 [Deltaproteobacteria bacterium]|nr:hypothetical protein [Deltaproteobacteria bacterium]